MTLLAALWLPASAAATTFSFGTIGPGDAISQLSFAPSTTKTEFDPATGVLHLEAYLSQVDFVGGGSIAGIASDAVSFTSNILLGSFSVLPTNPVLSPISFTAYFATFLPTDISIVDNFAPGGPITLLDANYIGNLQLSASEPGMNGQITSTLNALLTGDADFLSAFGNQATLNGNLTGFRSDNQSVGINMCNLVKGPPNTTIYNQLTTSTVCGSGGYALDDFTANANMTLTTTHMPEPGTALLLGLGLAGVAALRRK